MSIKSSQCSQSSTLSPFSFPPLPLRLSSQTLSSSSSHSILAFSLSLCDIWIKSFNTLRFIVFAWRAWRARNDWESGENDKRANNFQQFDRSTPYTHISVSHCYLFPRSLDKCVRWTWWKTSRSNQIWGWFQACSKKKLTLTDLIASKVKVCSAIRANLRRVDS